MYAAQPVIESAVFAHIPDRPTGGSLRRMRRLDVSRPEECGLRAAALPALPIASHAAA
jgi:hypothetical protein